jgi:ABC-type multidrug transport system ATPase subunit
VLLSTHVLQDVPEMASELVILKQGAVAFNGGVDEFLFGRDESKCDVEAGMGDVERRYLQLMGEAE